MARQEKQHQMTLDDRIESARANIVVPRSDRVWYEGEALYNAAKSAASDAVSQGVSCYVATGHAKTQCLRALRDRMRKA